MLDPKRLASCMPDLQELDVKSSDEFTVVVRTGVSFIKGDFIMNFKVAERIPSNHARLVARGSGMGSAIDLETSIDLSEFQGGTDIKWQAEARIGGRIASVGQRLISGQAEKIVKQLFDCLGSKLESA